MSKLLVYGTIGAADKTCLEKELCKGEPKILPREIVYKDSGFPETKVVDLRKNEGILNIIFWNTDLEKIKRCEASISKNMGASEAVVSIGYNPDGQKLPANTTTVMFCRSMSCIKPYLKSPVKTLAKSTEAIPQEAE